MTDSHVIFRDRSTGKVMTTEPRPGGQRKSVAVKPPKQRVGPTPVTIVAPEKTLAEKAAGAVPTRLGTPSALLMLVGLVLVYFALHGWDKKYGIFGGNFAGAGAPAVVARAAKTAAATAPTTTTAKPAATSVTQ